MDFLLRAKRDVAAAKAFFRRAFASQGRLPRKIGVIAESSQNCTLSRIE